MLTQETRIGNNGVRSLAPNGSKLHLDNFLERWGLKGKKKINATFIWTVF